MRYNLAGASCMILATSGSLLTATVNTGAQPAEGSVRLPPVTVSETPSLSEDQPIGPNQQPEWTTRRRFGTTRVYVSQPWQWEFEQWWNGKFPREGKSEHLFQSEISLGLPYRFQLDFYENVFVKGGTFEHQGNQ